MQPKQGDVWSYEYLWRWQHEEGSEHGRKPRPTALVATVVGKDNRTNLFILPITSKEPVASRLAMEVPQIERKRAGLSSDIRLWVIMDEYNHDILETSFSLDPNGKIGTFSSVFIGKVLVAFKEAALRGRVRSVPRTE
ncbi:hypothetical protein [Yoonia sp. R2-816]|uniref:hypothetical protein n=1 Tax=Yoonia sp. R2-816 TaxID=3342638 RepID=UPI00372CF379